MLVKMLENAKGADDGINVKEYIKDTEHELNVELAQEFIKMNVAKGIKKEASKKNENHYDEKAQNRTPSNKAVKGAPENK